jgi:hypothetical protein
MHVMQGLDMLGRGVGSRSAQNLAAALGVGRQLKG